MDTTLEMLETANEREVKLEARVGELLTALEDAVAGLNSHIAKFPAAKTAIPEITARLRVAIAKAEGE